MRAAVFNEPRSMSVAERPDPVIGEPTDAIVRVVLSCGVRLRPLVLPRRVAVRAGADRP
jgi:hypothetical protein